MRFSDIEVTQLTKAWLAISLAFAIVWRHMSLPFWQIYLLAALTVAIAFVTHEMAHKYVAQKFGCWAEFRSFDMGLILAVLASLLIGMIFVAPGAVVISGVVTTEENGKIAAAGPVTNLIVATLFWFLLRSLALVNLAFLPVSIVGFIYMFFQIGFGVSSWLALFNLIPFGPLDGLKVLRWSQGIWLALIAISGAMVFLLPGLAGA